MFKVQCSKFNRMALATLLVFGQIAPFAVNIARATVNEVSAANRYTGNGSTTAFTYGFKIFLNTDIEVLVDGVVKTLTTDYTVSGLGASGGGTVTFVTAPASAAKVTLLRKQKIEQQSDYIANETFSATAERIEKDLDKLAMQAQQVAETLVRAPKFAKKSTQSNIDVPEPAANTLLGWDSGGTKLENKTAAAAGVTITLGGAASQIDVGDSQDNGTATTASRSDHQHALPAPGNPVTQAFGDTASAGSSGKAAREDHKHGMPANPPGTYGSRGQNSKNNAATPNTQFDLDADVVILRNSTNQIVVRYDPGAAITNNILTAGAAANGRDQVGAFSADSWVHFYWIWDGTTLATVSSTVAPPTGPTLPTGYTHWSYAGAVRFDASSVLVKTRILGNIAYYEAERNALNAGAATAETAVSVSTLVSPNAFSTLLNVKARARVGVVSGRRNANLLLRVISGSNFKSSKIDQLMDNGSMATAFEVVIPNISQQFFYLWTLDADVSLQEATIEVMGYTLPNGGA